LQITNVSAKRFSDEVSKGQNVKNCLPNVIKNRSFTIDLKEKLLYNKSKLHKCAFVHDRVGKEGYF